MDQTVSWNVFTIIIIHNYPLFIPIEGEDLSDKAMEPHQVSGCCNIIKSTVQSETTRHKCTDGRVYS